MDIIDFSRRHLEQIKELLSEIESSYVFDNKDTTLAIKILQNKLRYPEDYEVKVAESRGIVLGFIVYSKADLSDYFYELHWISVHPKVQGRGIGKKLLDWVEADIKNNGGKVILLETSSDVGHSSARQLYEKLGYKVISVISNFYSDKEDKIFYQKILGS